MKDLELRLVASGRASKMIAYSIYMQEPYGSREIRNLIRALELSASFLEEDEAAERAPAHPPSLKGDPT